MEKKPTRIKNAALPTGKWRNEPASPSRRCTFMKAKGLIRSQRNAGNQRRYRRDVLRAVAIIKIAQRIGIPLATIGEGIRRPAGRGII